MIKILYYVVMSGQAVSDHIKQTVPVIANYILIALAITYAVFHGYDIYVIIEYGILLAVMYFFKGIASGDVKVLLSYSILNSINGIGYLAVHLLATTLLLVIFNIKKIIRKPLDTHAAMIPEILSAAIVLEVLKYFY